MWYGLLPKFSDKISAIVRSREFWISFFLIALYMSPPGFITSGDVTPARLLPLSIIRDRDFDLNEFHFLYNDGEKLPYFLHNVDGRLVSRYPIFTPLLAVPVYAIPLLMGYRPECINEQINIYLLSRVTAAAVTLLSSLFMYWTLKRLSRERIAFLITIIYSLATSNWPVSSQDLWQHGPGVLFISITLYLFTRALEEPKYIKFAGFTASMAVGIRPINLVIILILSAYVFKEHKTLFLKYIVYSLPVILIMLLYSITYLHSVFSLGQMLTPSQGWTTPIVDGLLGLLISPSRGLFVYHSVLIISIAGIIYSLTDTKEKNNKAMRYYSVAVILMVLVWSKWWAWYGGASFVPRMLTEITPFLCLFLIHPVEIMLKKRMLTLILTLLITASILMNVLMMVKYDCSWFTKYNLTTVLSKEFNMSQEEKQYVNTVMWDIKNNEWLYYLNNQPHKVKVVQPNNSNTTICIT